MIESIVSLMIFLHDRGEAEEADIVPCRGVFQRLIPGFNIDQYSRLWGGANAAPEGDDVPVDNAAE
jgi:hypothetical protein